VTLISAPAGSGKTMLVSTWLNGGRDVAWVGVERDETDPIRFWAAVMDALRASGALPADDPLATLTPAPAGGQDEFLARLLDGLDRLSRELLLVLDDLHELRSAAAIQGLEQLLGARPCNSGRS
jgi:LuxR family maltose regulon positive regulatory protein